MAKRNLFPLVCLVAAITGCTPAPAPATSAKSGVETPKACGDNDRALPGTGLCASGAAGLLALAPGDRPNAPRGCMWTVNEAPFADEFLLYYAAKCAGKVTTLEYAGGAHMAELTYVTSAISGDAVKGQKAVRIAGGGRPGEPNAGILGTAREALGNPALAAKCQVFPAKNPNWPTDALVVDVSPAEAAKARKDEPRTACGPFGLDEDSQSFWRVFQGFSWYFELGQDEMEVDPGSFTLVHKDDKGQWVRSSGQ